MDSAILNLEKKLKTLDPNSDKATAAVSVERPSDFKSTLERFSSHETDYSVTSPTTERQSIRGKVTGKSRLPAVNNSDTAVTPKAETADQHSVTKATGVDCMDGAILSLERKLKAPATSNDQDPSMEKAVVFRAKLERFSSNGKSSESNHSQINGGFPSDDLEINGQGGPSSPVPEKESDFKLKLQRFSSVDNDGQPILLRYS